jgi:hypothetical protein
MSDGLESERLDARLTTIPLFKGDEAKYPNWLRVFMSACDRQNCVEALRSTHAAALPANPNAGNLTDPQKLAVKKNKDAVNLLNTALQGDTMGLFITKTYTDAYPLGVAWRVMEGLRIRFNPKGIDTSVNYQNEMAAVSMRQKENPGLMIDKIEGIKARYTLLGVTIRDEDLVARALVAAHPDYKSVLVSEKRLRDEGLTLDHIRECMKTLYDATYGSETKQTADESDKEMSLTNVTSDGVYFPGTCHTCGKRGHKQEHCTASIICECCGKNGHDESQCWFKAGNEIPDGQQDQAIEVLRKQIAEMKAASCAASRQGTTAYETQEMMLCQLDVDETRKRCYADCTSIVSSAHSVEVVTSYLAATSENVGEGKCPLVDAGEGKPAPSAGMKATIVRRSKSDEKRQVTKCPPELKTAKMPTRRSGKEKPADVAMMFRPNNKLKDDWSDPPKGEDTKIEAMSDGAKRATTNRQETMSDGVEKATTNRFETMPVKLDEDQGYDDTERSAELSLMKATYAGKSAVYAHSIARDKTTVGEGRDKGVLLVTELSEVDWIPSTTSSSDFTKLFYGTKLDMKGKRNLWSSKEQCENALSIKEVEFISRICFESKKTRGEGVTGQRLRGSGSGSELGY